MEPLTLLSAGFKTLKEVVTAIKAIKELLPENKKNEVSMGIDGVEANLKIAEAQIAQALGYQLCQCEFPPVIMLNVENSGRNKIFQCPKCNKKYPNIYEGEVPQPQPEGEYV